MSHIIIPAGETLLLLLLLLLVVVVVVFRVDATPSRRRRRAVGRHLFYREFHLYRGEFFHPQKKTKFREEDEESSLSLSHLGYRLFSAFFFWEEEEKT